MTGIKPGGTLPAVNMEFVNREAELRELDGAAKHGGLLVVFGRRRVGKTRLLRDEGLIGLNAVAVLEA